MKQTTVSFSDEQINDLRLRLSMRRMPEKETVDDWSQGIPLHYLEELASYWETRYDMRRLENRINAFPQFSSRLNDIDIHFIHIRSKETQARPLILHHGWPGSIVEFLEVILKLVDPVAHGGSEKDAFHVICPSLPGYGFSGKPSKAGCGVEKIAKISAQLMQKLGYTEYFAQGGDWGSAITSELSKIDEHCKAIHLNMLTPASAPPISDRPTQSELDAIASMKFYARWDSGYSQQQRTRPQTIGYSLVDSPVGLLAWIVEKFHAWTDCDGHPENALSRDLMLDNVMVYWMNATGASSARLYWESFGTLNTENFSKPTGVTVFPKEIVRVPRHWAEKHYTNIQYWNEVEKGGHFAAFEQPTIFVKELRAFFATQ